MATSAETTPERSIASLEESPHFCRAIDSPTTTALVGGFLGSAHVRAGRTEEAATVLREATERGEAAGLGDATLPRGVGLASLAEAHARVGRIAEAAGAGQLAILAIFTRMKARGYAAWTLHLLANIAAREPRTSDAVMLYQQALSMAMDLGTRPWRGIVILAWLICTHGQGTGNRQRKLRS